MIEQTNRLLNFTIPAGTLVPRGGYLVAAQRDQDRVPVE
jgi:hypothetical protein